MDDSPQLLRPQPRRPWKNSADNLILSTSPPNDFASQLEERLRRTRGPPSDAGDDASTTPKRNTSFMNLAGSTLLGIYSDGNYSEQSEPVTPWGTGAETPARRPSGLGFPSPRILNLDAIRGEVKKKKKAHTATPVEKTLVILALFVVGVAYGIVVAHIHEHGQLQIAPVRLEQLDHGSVHNLIGWGIASIVLGSVLPWLDGNWEMNIDPKPKRVHKQDDDHEEDADNPLEAGQLSQIVRSIGVFVGVAFAIRKLAWRSTLQISMTLAAVNPALWYICDRTKPGFALASLVATAGTIGLLLTNPSVVPVPHPTAMHTGFFNSTSSDAADHDLIPGLITYEHVGVVTWISSVLFCATILFGNIGRELFGWWR